MESILFLGYSNLVKTRILPIIHQAGFDEVAIAKYEGQMWDDAWQSCQVPVVRYDDYAEGLARFQGQLVYVSTVNSRHAFWARASLSAGFHTVIDKPATSTAAEAEDLLSLARSKHLLLAESTVYLCHPQMAAVRQIFDDFEDAPKLMTVHFSMPPFRLDNFRYQRSLGGGAIMDTAPYAVSVGRFFFGAKPLSADCIVTERQPDGLDIEYSLLMQYPGGRTLIGHFGFNTEYINRVQLMGNRTNVSLDRVFTIPDTLENTIRVRHMNGESVVTVPCGNNFLLYLKQIRQRIAAGAFEDAYAALLMDAEVKDAVMDSANSRE